MKNFLQLSDKISSLFTTIIVDLCTSIYQKSLLDGNCNK
jgi:hypothetical protein